MNDCIFCRIAGGTLPSKMCYEDDHVVAFHDTNPQAPQHVLVVPRRHLASLNDADEKDAELLGRLLLAARRVARELGCASGYRLVTNCGASAGQSVFHLHVHMLGGRPLSWPPG
jgi:histidine triad (HIT) family protein